MTIQKWPSFNAPPIEPSLPIQENTTTNLLMNDPYDLDITITDQSSEGIQELTGSQNCTRRSLCQCNTDACVTQVRCSGIEGYC